ncbi:poly(A) polymerase catalytic subunit [Bodo saltans virus]|uniref:Putative poly(A) polymerase catalytic subunit n=1 Tax=Bodo saltans virus TaxID=2024608 RepID=A0A2H4UUV8_9VIRU|nr:poly(A) polymerase catalytic subunit [Bodo saltans virus]ATZ80711.1 poly(A) polymerase catalytic subunit [Bodo saltans virus]
MLYTDGDIELLKNKADDIRDKLEKIKQTNSEPSQEDLKKAHEIVKDYVKSKKRKLYGGFALHLLLVNKNKDKGIYKSTKIPDIDTYSIEPMDDMQKLCNLLHNSGFKEIQGIEAMHAETYSIKYYNETLCDFSYVPKNIFNRMPFIEVDGFRCIHPNFMTIDYLRMLSNPMDSYWRFFDCGTELKAFSRFRMLLSEYPVQYNDKQLNIMKPSPKVQNLKSIIFNYLNNKKTTVVIGFYAYNYFCKIAGYDTIDIPYYEFISVDYKKDALELIELLKKENDEILHEEFTPFFQFTDYSVEIYVKDDIVCRIYNHLKKCIPYQNVESKNFDEKKLKRTQTHLQSGRGTNNIQIGSFILCLLYTYINAQRARVNENVQTEKLYYHMASHLINMRNEYLKKIKKTFLDNTIFADFTLDCIGEEITSEKAKRMKIAKRKAKKKPIIYRYTPADEYRESTPKYIYSNTSGNKIVNTKNLLLGNNVKNDDDDTEIEDIDIGNNDKDSDDDNKENVDDNKENNDAKQNRTKVQKEIKLHLSQPHFDDVKNGKKKFEGRLYKEKFSNTRLGDIIIWENDNKTFLTKIKSIRLFNTFFEAIESVGLENILPTQAKKHKDDTTDDAIKKSIEEVYREWYSYDDEMEYGIVLFELQKN